MSTQSPFLPRPQRTAYVLRTYAPLFSTASSYRSRKSVRVPSLNSTFPANFCPVLVVLFLLFKLNFSSGYYTYFILFYSLIPLSRLQLDFNPNIHQNCSLFSCCKIQHLFLSSCTASLQGLTFDHSIFPKALTS